MAIPDDGARGGTARLDKAGLDEWIARLDGLERRIKAQLKRETADAVRAVGRHPGMSGSVQLRDRHLLALRGALKAVQNLADALRELRGKAGRAGGALVDIDTRNAADMPDGAR